ncbi:hypothetical protein PsYK624_080660 [Phanerochaete sordida]|uniref:Uncharacterized protein n=1 Tax=Phanerochaete sordida TaxID=48140 RepID=A0A9P3LET0_9APHY|nr:hypothetical protein PsYK624_080660 [Phanerochaete sordida]
MALRDAPAPAADGLLLALPALRAELVVLQGALAHGAPPMVRRVDATIARLVRAGTWPLHTFVVAQNDGYYLTDTLAAALAASPTLRRLVIDPYYLLVRAFLAQVATVATNPGLQQIACLPEPMFARNTPINLNEILQRERDPAMRERLRGLLTYHPTPVF